MKTVTIACAVALLLGGMAFGDDTQTPVTSFGGYFNSGLVINHNSTANYYNNYSNDYGGWGNYVEAQVTTKANNWGFFIQPLYQTNNGTATVSLYQSYAWASPVDGLKIEIGTGNDVAGLNDLDDNANNGFNAEGVTIDFKPNSSFEIAALFNGRATDPTTDTDVNWGMATVMAGFNYNNSLFTVNAYGGTLNGTNKVDTLYATLSLSCLPSGWSLAGGYDVSGGLTTSSERADLADLSISYNVGDLTVGVVAYDRNISNGTQYYTYKPNVSYNVSSSVVASAYFLGDTLSGGGNYEPQAQIAWTVAPGAVVNFQVYYDTKPNGADSDAQNNVFIGRHDVTDPDTGDVSRASDTDATLSVGIDFVYKF